MSLPEEQIRAQQRAWDLMTGQRKNWTRANFYAATRHFLHPAQLQSVMNRLAVYESAQRLSREDCRGKKDREITMAIAETLKRTMHLEAFKDDLPAKYLPEGYTATVRNGKATVRKIKEPSR